MDVNRVVAQIERDFEPSHVGRLLDHIRQPSVSALDWGNQEMSGMLAEEIREAGGQAEVVETSEFPVVFGLIGIFRSFALALPEAVIALQRGPETLAPLRRFCITIGLVTSGLLLLIGLTPLGALYLNTLIGLAPGLTALALPGVLLGVGIPFVGCIQSYWRGVLMGQRATRAVYLAMMINLLTLAAALALGVWLRWPGVQLAIVALTLSLLTEGVYLYWWVSDQVKP